MASEFIDLSVASDKELVLLIAVDSERHGPFVARLLAKVRRRSEVEGPQAREARERAKVVTNVAAIQEATATAAVKLGLRGNPTPAVPDVSDHPEIDPVANIVPISAPVGERRPLSEKEWISTNSRSEESGRAWISQKKRREWSATHDLQDKTF